MARWTVPEYGRIVMEYNLSALGCRVKVNDALYQDAPEAESLRRQKECQAIAWEIAARHEKQMQEEEAAFYSVMEAEEKSREAKAAAEGQ